MSVKTVGGKLQHRAYCGKHNVEQKAKVCVLHIACAFIKSILEIIDIELCISCIHIFFEF